MKITNHSTENIECYVDQEYKLLKPEKTTTITNDFSIITFKQIKQSYTLPPPKQRVEKRNSRKSNMLNDPLLQMKKTHLVTDFSISKEDCKDHTDLKLCLKERLADKGLQIYYDYICVNTQQEELIPTKSTVIGEDLMLEEFSENNKKVVKSDAIFNIIDRPFLSGGIGGILAAFVVLFLGLNALWGSIVAWSVVGVLAIPVIALKIYYFIKDSKKSPMYVKQFNRMLRKEQIWLSCYDYVKSE